MMIKLNEPEKNTLEYIRKCDNRCFWGVRDCDNHTNHYRTGDGGKGVWVQINDKWYEIHWVKKFEVPLDDDAAMIDTIIRRCFCNKIAVA